MESKKKRVWALPKATTKLQSPVTTYFLTDEQLEHYRNLPRPVKENEIRTTAPRKIKNRRVP